MKVTSYERKALMALIQNHLGIKREKVPPKPDRQDLETALDKLTKEPT